MSSEHAYTVTLSKRAERQLARLPEDVQRRLTTRLLQLRDEPRGRGVRKMSGREDRYRVRAGDYRALFKVDDQTRQVTVTAVGHRSQVYDR
jgi:mRNA interferase RelE/StbE